MASHDVPIGANQVSLAQLNERSREIFRQIVESYLATGEPVGSRNLARIMPMTLSPASVRNVMSDLEQLGLIYAPHTSAGRLPTELGLRFFVDALMQVGDLTESDRRSIEAQVAAAGSGKSMETVLTEASQMLSGLTRSAGVVLTAQDQCAAQAYRIRAAGAGARAGRAGRRGRPGRKPRPQRAGRRCRRRRLIEAGNFLNARIRGKTLAECASRSKAAMEAGQAELDQLTQKIIAAGLASWSGGESEERKLIVRGHANLLEDLHALEDLERVRSLFDALGDQARRDRSARPRRARPTACASSSARRTSCFRCPAPRPSWRPIATARAASSA